MVCVILVAEDEILVRNVVRHILESDGHHVLAAADGAEALQLSRKYQGKIDLLITDIVMPKLDGLGLIREILEDRPNLRVVVMSAWPNEALSSFPFLRKPFEIAAFRNVVRNVLDERPH
jgi:CheY-like chemotaxis protein